MKITKRVISMLLCVVMCLSFFSGIPAYAENGNDDADHSEAAELVTNPKEGSEGEGSPKAVPDGDEEALSALLEHAEALPGGDTAIPNGTLNGVKYIDDKGAEQIAGNVTEITEGREYGAGWYVLNGTKSLGRIIFNGTANLIIADDANVTISGGILLNGETVSLTIYGQSAGTGKLTVNGVRDYCAGIGSGEYSKCGDITINGGTVTAIGGVYCAGIGTASTGHCGNITIYGDFVKAKGGKDNTAHIGASYVMQGGSCGTVSYGSCKTYTDDGWFLCY